MSSRSHCHTHCHFCVSKPLVILPADVMPGKRKAEDTAVAKPKPKAAKGKPVAADAPKDDFSINAVHYAEVLEAWNQIMKFLDLIIINNYYF